MNNRRKTIYSIAGVAAIGTAAIFAPIAVHAQTTPTDLNSFASELAQKLGIEQSKVEVAMDEIHTERHNEMAANAETKIDEALSAGTITSEQATQLRALVNLDFEKPDLTEEEIMAKREEFQNATQEERQALREEQRTERQASVIEKLADQGITVTSDQLDELQNLARDLGLRGGFGGPGGHHVGGKGMGMMK